jgi:2-oxo-hept-3-ene-1,7-dioate hydratase
MRNRLHHRPRPQRSRLHDLRCAERDRLHRAGRRDRRRHTLREDPETDAPRQVQDSIADNAGNAALVIGGRPVKPSEVDLRWVAALCYRNGVVEESGVAAAVMNHPANSVAWLANKLATYGVALEPGQVVLGGSFTRTVPARAGDVFHIDYGPLGSIICRFV